MKNLNKALLFVVVLMFSIVISSCDTPRTIKYSISNTSMPNIKSSQLLSSIPAYIKIPDGYDYFIKDNTFSNVLQKHGVTQEEVNSYLSLSNKEIHMVPYDQKVSTSNSEIYVRVQTDKQSYSDIGDLKRYTDKEINTFAQGFVKGFGVNEFKIYKNQYAVFIVFDWESVNKEARCATIVNNKMVYIVAVRENGDITKADREALEIVLNSFVLK